MLSVLDFDYLFAEKYYKGLEGGILEAFGKLFSDNTNVYVYPTIKDDGELVSLENADVDDDLKFLMQHLIHNRAMVSAEVENKENLAISAQEVIDALRKGRGDWEKQVPDVVAKRIIDQKLLGYKS